MNAHHPRRRGFSLVEILIVVAVIGVVSTIAIPLVTGVPDAAKKEKLEQDVVVVNNAIDAYLASGGDPGQLTSDNLLAALKSRVYGGMPAEMMGPQGPFLDLTVTTNSTDFSWSAALTPGPRPRFVVEQSAAGVIFGRGPATEVGGVAEQADDARPSWLWSYTETQPLVANAEIFRPGTVESPGTFSSAALTDLVAPGFSPSGGTFPLAAFAALKLVLSNPNPDGSSRVFFSTDQGASWAAYESPISIAPGEVRAQAVSLDPSRYSSSPVSNNEYRGQPVLTWSNNNTALTYAQVASGSFSVSVSADGNGPFGIFYTTDGTTPSAESTVTGNGVEIPLQPGMWTSGNLVLQAKGLIDANAQYYDPSETETTTVAAEPEALGAPVVTPPGQIVFGSLAVSFAPAPGDPSGVRFFYTTDGTTPTPETGTEGAFVIVSNLGVSEQRNVRVIAAPPAGLEFWFTPSGAAAEIYQGLNFDYYNLEGVLVGGGTIANNAALNGSVVLVSVAGQQPNVTFANNSVLEGDVYAPGTPTVTGVSATNIVDLDGAISPTNYSINILKADFTGKVFRRITAVTMPIITLPEGLTTTTNTVTSGTLLPGRYSNVDPGNGASITLGVAGATEPSVYVFDQFNTGNNFTLNVVGPVRLVLNPGTGMQVELGNNVILGNKDNPEWFQINMFTGNIRVGNGSAMYGSILNPNGTVSFQQGSTFFGGVTAKFINIENNVTGVVFGLPPPS